MFPIYAIPSQITRMFSCYADCFSRRTDFTQFLRYMTGLVMPFSGKRTIDGINKLFCGELSCHQSTTNRFLTESPWQEEALIERRIEALKAHPLLRPGHKGVISIDDVLLEKTGPQIDGVGVLYDPSQDKDILCHCLVTCTYNKLGQSYPLFFEPYFTEAVCQNEQGMTLKLVFRTKIAIAIEIVNKVQAAELAGVFAFDSWYLTKDLIAAIEVHERLWVAKAAKDTRVNWRGQAMTLEQMTEQLPKSAYHKIHHHGKVYYCALKHLVVCCLGQDKAVLVCWKDQIGQGHPFYILTNALWYDATRILLIYSQRWPIEEVHREGQQHEGLAEYQMRTLAGIRKHGCLVACAYAGLTLARAYDLRGIPRVLTLYSMSMDLVLEVALAFVRRVWDTAMHQPNGFLIIQRELEAFYRRFQITVQKPISAFRLS